MCEPYYITTAISYPNGKPHIGHAYEAIAADVIARFKKAQGFDVRLVTGTDEHGLKMDKTASTAGRDTLEFATEMSNHFRDMCAALHIDYSAFRCTTEAQHNAASVALWEAMAANGDLYLDRYEGWYSIRDEADVEPLGNLEARDDVGRDRLVGMADVRASVGVADRGGKIIGFRHRRAG